MNLKNRRSSYPVPGNYRMNKVSNSAENSDVIEKYFGEDLLKLPPSSAGVYRKPLYYGLIHVLSGFLAFHYSWFGIVFLIYQLSQLILNKRFFIFQGKMEDGNSLGHTGFKLGEFLVGMLIAFVIHKIYPKFKLLKDRFSS
jgi:hypothetical protein